ncbi:MAG: hypothetical protein ACE5E8_04885 [Acidimicrobiia bacterium]
MAERMTGPPWPQGPFVLDLDHLDRMSMASLASLESRSSVSIGATAGRCEGQALAAAMAVDLLVAGPHATFGHPGTWANAVIRRGTWIGGRKVMAYLSMTDRVIDAALAVRWGLVTAMADDPTAEASALAGEIARRSTVAVATIVGQAHRGASADYARAGVTGAAAGSR